MSCSRGTAKRRPALRLATCKGKPFQEKRNKLICHYLSKKETFNRWTISNSDSVRVKSADRIFLSVSLLNPSDYSPNQDSTGRENASSTPAVNLVIPDSQLAVLGKSSSGSSELARSRSVFLPLSSARGSLLTCMSLFPLLS